MGNKEGGMLVKKDLGVLAKRTYGKLHNHHETKGKTNEKVGLLENTKTAGKKRGGQNALT